MVWAEEAAFLHHSVVCLGIELQGYITVSQSFPSCRVYVTHFKPHLAENGFFPLFLGGAKQLGCASFVPKKPIPYTTIANKFDLPGMWYVSSTIRLSGFYGELCL